MSHSFVLDINKDGTLSLPLELIKELGVDRSNRVLVLNEDGRIRLIPDLMTLEDIRGSAPALPNLSEDFDDEIE